MNNKIGMNNYALSNFFFNNRYENQTLDPNRSPNVPWNILSMCVFSAAQTLLNDHMIIIGILYEQQAAVCLYGPVALPWPHVCYLSGYTTLQNWVFIVGILENIRDSIWNWQKGRTEPKGYNDRIKDLQPDGNLTTTLLLAGCWDYLMSGYLAASPETSRVSMPGSFSLMKSARTGSNAKGFTSGTDPSPSCRHMSLIQMEL